MYIEDYQIEAIEKAIKRFKGEDESVSNINDDLIIAKHLEELLLDISLDPENNR